MKRLLLLIPLALWSCSKATKTEPPVVAAEPTPPPSASAPAPSAAPSAQTLRPPDGSPPREEREKAAFALLSGQKSAASLPLAATDPGEPFDPRLRKQLQTGGRAVVKFDPPGGDGIPTEAIQSALQASRGRLLRCYRAGLSLNPNLQGRIQAKITLAPPGKPALVENAGSDLPDPGVVRCILDTLGRGVFPAAEGKAVTATIHFSPG